MDLLGAPPFIRTPLTHIYHIIGGESVQNSHRKQCSIFESNYLNCLQAHGFDKGLVICRDFFEDLVECKFGRKEAYRIKKINEQRRKLYKEGKIKDRYYEMPSIDAYHPPYP